MASCPQIEDYPRQKFDKVMISIDLRGSRNVKIQMIKILINAKYMMIFATRELWRGPEKPKVHSFRQVANSTFNFVSI